ncbi:hypothetical protein [Aliarcobacter butzleri]|uniref:hypothetical protein n=1 Tax=Aliarcobacter butzleri TaxID=28197 RepID=UPI00125ED653|nr:hypothetical protein [Aliarcobacter butzleri]
MNLYDYLNMNITRVENIQEVVNNKIDSYCNLLDEIEDLEECKGVLIDLALEIRTQMNLLFYATDSLNKFNTDMLLNSSRKPDEHISPLYDIKFKKELLKHRY